jgi:uncharacterized protein YdaU (DUF1376 family)
MHYYKRNLGDYAKKAGRLSMLQHGAYTLLIDACYDREQFPTRDEAIDWTWASSTAEIEAVDFVLRKFFVLENGFYVQKRIQDELASYHATSETNKRIATEREARRNASLADRAPAVDEPPPNHKPLTTNQEPEEEKKPTASSAAKLPTCPTAELIDLYHEALPELPKVRLHTKDRVRAIKRVWDWTLTSKRPDGTKRAEGRDDAMEWFRSYFERARENDFLMGRGKRSDEHANWRCDLDFLLTERGMKHVIEKTDAGQQRGARA